LAREKEKKGEEGVCDIFWQNKLKEGNTMSAQAKQRKQVYEAKVEAREQRSTHLVEFIT